MNLYKKFFGFLVVTAAFSVLSHGFLGHAQALEESDFSKLEASEIRVTNANKNQYILKFPDKSIFTGAQATSDAAKGLTYAALFDGTYSDQGGDGSKFNPSLGGYKYGNGTGQLRGFKGTVIDTSGNPTEAEIKEFVKDVTLRILYDPNHDYIKDGIINKLTNETGKIDPNTGKAVNFVFIWGNNGWEKTSFDKVRCSTFDLQKNYDCGKQEKMRDNKGAAFGDRIIEYAKKAGGGSLDIGYTYSDSSNEITDTISNEVFSFCGGYYAHPSCSPGKDNKKITLQSGADLKTCKGEVAATLSEAGKSDKAIKIPCLDNPANINTPSGTAAGTDVSCASKAKLTLGWALCGVLSFLEAFANWMTSIIGRLLFVDVGSMFGDSLYQSWRIIARLSTIIIVIVALLMIFSESMGAGIMDNYSVKKILPRLVLAGIGVQLSWVGCRLAVEVFNALGNGVFGLLTAPFSKDLSNGLGNIITADGVYNVKTGIGAAATVGGMIVLAVMSVGSIVTALFIGFVTLVARQMILLLCIALAPIALAAWVLPGTQKVSKLWYETFSKALAMFPIVMGLLAAGRIVGIILINTNDDFVNKVAGVVAWFLPYALIPAALKAGGSLLGKLSGFANDKSKGPIDRLSKMRENRKGLKKSLSESERNARLGQNRSWYNPRKRYDILRSGTAGGISPTSRRALQQQRNELASKGVQEQAQRDAAAQYAKANNGQALAIDQATVQAEKILVQGRNFELDSARSEIKLQEDKVATQRANLELQNMRMITAPGETEPRRVNVKEALDEHGRPKEGYTIGGGIYGVKPQLSDIVTDPNQSIALRQAALEKLFAMGASKETRLLSDHFGYNDQGEKGAGYDNAFAAKFNTTLTADGFAAFKDKAPDLAKGGLSNVFKVVGGKVEAPSAEDAVKFSADTWTAAFDAAAYTFKIDDDGNKVVDQDAVIKIKEHLKGLAQQVAGDQQLSRQLDAEKRSVLSDKKTYDVSSLRVPETPDNTNLPPDNRGDAAYQ